MKVLNLYAGLGGNRKYWTNCHVTAVEISPKIAATYAAMYPDDRVVVSDAHQFLQDNFKEYDFIWSSPPCQSHSKMALVSRRDKPTFPDMKLYEEIIFLRQFAKNCKWVVENVKPYYHPLILPDQRIVRHLFWSNFDFMAFEVPSLKGIWGEQKVSGSERLKKYLGINYEGNIYYEKGHSPSQVLRNCVHPLVGRHIFESCFGTQFAA